jgi:hypothetical protein
MGRPAWMTRRPFAGRRGRGGLYAARPAEPLELQKPPDYELSDRWREEARQEVERLIDSLKPGALDAGSREVLHNLINARIDRALATLDAERDDRIAIGRVLVRMASAEVARRKPVYEADSARSSHAAAAVAVTFEALTGKRATDYLPAGPARAGEGPLSSTVGAIDLRLDDPVLDRHGGELYSTVDGIELHLDDPDHRSRRGEPDGR